MIHGKLGAQLRQIRQQRGMSIRTLAARSGFSPSFISQVEADQVSPSIASLEKIAGQLGISLGHLFSSLEAKPRNIVRTNDRMVYRSGWSHSVVEALNDVAVDRRIFALQVTFEAGGSTGKRPAPSWQDTIIYVISGTLQLVLRDEEDVEEITNGDAVYLQEGDLFLIRNERETPAVLLLVGVARTPHFRAIDMDTQQEPE
jgi:transcriptional regulator with XRE-family HTH domain